METSKILKKAFHPGLAGIAGILMSCQPVPSETNEASTDKQDAAQDKPNVLFIAVDDLRDWVGYSTKFSNVKTPHLDKLAGESMVFTDAYCAAPVCSPSRTALLTGLSPAETGFQE
jgi:hypothetical protein